MTNTISTVEFAAELDTDTRTARKFLRSITPKEDQPGKGARWAITGTKTNLNKMRKQFSAWSEKQEQEKKAREAEKAPEPDAAEMVDLDD